jgi:5-methylcytosine-specific restriction endonuclease McrA
VRGAAGVGSPGRALPRLDRLRIALERDGPHCVWCRRELQPGDRLASTEHVIPRLKGGPAWIENEVAACRSCNRRRGHAAPVAWLEECERRGLNPDRAAIARSLRALDEAIAERGGQRRARPYLAAQLRRLSRSRAAP